MANINLAVVEGNLTQAATLSRWGDGTAYCRFTIANNEYYKKGEEYESIPSYIDCQCKGPYAEAMAKHLLKGRRITVTGRLKQNRWTDDNGIKHSAIVIKVSEISLAPFGNNSFRPSQQNEQYNNNSAQMPEENYDSQTDYSDVSMFDDSEEIPF